MNEDKLTSAFRKIRARIAGMSGADTDTEDSLQEAFCRLWTRRDSISDSRAAEGILTVTARHIRIDMQRRRTSHPETDLEDIRTPISEDAPDDYSGLYAEVSSLISRHLSERDREILLRRERDGWEFDEIARHFKISEANARVIIARSRKKIRDLYNQHKNHL